MIGSYDMHQVIGSGDMHLMIGSPDTHHVIGSPDTHHVIGSHDTDLMIGSHDMHHVIGSVFTNPYYLCIMILNASEINCFENLQEKFQFLFEADLIREICQFGKLKKFDGETTLMDIDDTITNMPIVISGSIKILTEDKEGNELLLYYLEAGDTCAVTLNCCTRKSKSTIRAITETPAEIQFVPVEKMEEWMIKYQSWRRYVLDSYNIRLNEMVSAIDNIVFNNMEDRLKNYLRDKAWVTKSEILNISHANIANDLHSSRVVISRLMKKLENDGIIKQTRNRIEFLEFSKPKQ